VHSDGASRGDGGGLGGGGGSVAVYYVNALSLPTANLHASDGVNPYIPDQGVVLTTQVQALRFTSPTSPLTHGLVNIAFRAWARRPVRWWMCMPTAMGWT